jgi:aarF domain-containing kinase
MISRFQPYTFHLCFQRRLLASSNQHRFQSWIRTNPKTVIGGLATVLITGATASLVYHVQDQVGGLEGLSRTLSFYSLAVPKYIEYRIHQYLDSPDETWDQLHDETSKKGLDKILQLKGFYIKSGQMCAANFGNAFPPIWQRNMAILQDQCPHEEFPVVKEIIQSEFPNLPFSTIFSYVDPKPIGAASIGQVHRAILARDGTHVVVKIMYPNVEGVFRGDVRTIKMFAQLAQPVHVPPLEEVEKQFMTEFDYKREAEQLDQVRRNLIQAGLADDNDQSTNRGRRLCRIPKPYMDLCTKRVLVMEELEGIKLVDGLRLDLERHAARAGMTVDDFKVMLDEKKQSQMDEYGEGAGPSAFAYDKYIRLVDAQRKLNNLGRWIYNYTVGILPRVPKKCMEGPNILPLNHAKLIDDLIHIHGHEVLVDGFFNGDPVRIMISSHEPQVQFDNDL